MVCRPGLFMDMSYLNYVTAPPVMPAYMTFTFFLNPYLCHPNLYSCISYTMFTRLIFCCMCVPLVLEMGIRTKARLLSQNLQGATSWGVGQSSDPGVTRIFQADGLVLNLR